MDISPILFNGSFTNLNNYQIYSVTGDDRESFLQGQTTNDVKKLSRYQSHLNTRLDRTGRLVSFFHLFKRESDFLILTTRELAQNTKEDLEKYIIMEDVEILPLEEKPLTLFLGPKAQVYQQNIPEKLKPQILPLEFYGEKALLFLEPGLSQSCIDETYPQYKLEELETLRILSGYPQWGSDVSEKTLLNESYLNNVAISYDKGCFLGQETVAKIQTRRGASYFPVLLQLSNEIPLSPQENLFVEGTKKAIFFSAVTYNNKTYARLSLHRDLRVQGKKLSLINQENKKLEGIVHYLPFFAENSAESRAQILYDQALHLFAHENKEDEAKELLLSAIHLLPSFADAYESLGVIYGRHGEYNKAIELMKKLSQLDPHSVMAHTNLSLYLMKVGKIEEAEDEKAKAAVLSFEQHGHSTEKEVSKRAREQEKEQDLKRREGMFLEVLEIDPEDTLANYGLGEINLERGKYDRAVQYLSQVIEADPQYSVAYLALGKSYEGLNNLKKAQEVYEKGIDIAAKKGDLMPANEMQSRLSQLGLF